VLMQRNPDMETQTEDVFQIAIKSRIYHADLLAASEKMGGIQHLADHLGVKYSAISDWIRLDRFPRLQWIGKNGAIRRNEKLARKWPSITKKLFALTGKSIKELFPEFVKFSGILEAKKNIVKVCEVNAGMMLGFQEKETLAIPYSEQSISRSEVVERIEEVMKTLTFREREVIRLRYDIGGDGQTYSLAEVGRILNISQERVRQIEAKSFRKLRLAERSDLLNPALEAIDFHECPGCQGFFPNFHHCEFCTAVLCGECMTPHRLGHVSSANDDARRKETENQPA
jgi:RNA polymerase sigma factor (sigma-70 family)